MEEVDHQGSREAGEPDAKARTAGLRNEHDDSNETSDPRRNLKCSDEVPGGETKACRAHRAFVDSIEISHVRSGSTQKTARLGALLARCVTRCERGRGLEWAQQNGRQTGTSDR